MTSQVDTHAEKMEIPGVSSFPICNHNFAHFTLITCSLVKTLNLKRNYFLYFPHFKCCTYLGRINSDKMFFFCQTFVCHCREVGYREGERSCYMVVFCCYFPLICLFCFVYTIYCAVVISAQLCCFFSFLLPPCHLFFSCGVEGISYRNTSLCSLHNLIMYSF